MPRGTKPVIIGQNERVTIKQVDRLANEYTMETGYHTEAPDPCGQFMMHLVERFGIIAGTVGPEDSAGRATLVLQPEADVVKRAATLAELTFAEMRQRGWMVKLTRPGDDA